MASGSHSSWRAEDLLDLERCGLAADLASTNLEPVGTGNGWGQDSVSPMGDIGDVNTYDMSVLVSNLLDDNSDLPLLSPASVATPTGTSGDLGAKFGNFEVHLKAPSAYGIKVQQEKVTYLNRGQSYEIHLQHFSANPAFYSCTFSLSFCDIRWRNSEREHFEQWSRDHPCDQLLEIDLSGSQGLLGAVRNPGDTSLGVAGFSWGQSGSATVALKVHCLSTEFAAKKHGGEKGVPLKLHLEMRQCECGMNSGCGHRCECPVVYQGACSVKVFKDKGGDRKQRQDMSKIEKLPPSELIKYHSSEVSTRFEPVTLSNCFGTPSSSTSKLESSSNSAAYTPGASPYNIATPPSSLPLHNSTPSSATTTPPSSVTSCSTVMETQQWLVLNRFDQYCSLFANYMGSDLQCLSRQDLMDLCGHADGIRLYNCVHSRILKTLYVRLALEDKVYQAVCLQQLTAKALLMQLLDKTGWLNADRVSSFLRLTESGLLVRVDDQVVQGMQQEHHFLLETIKDENGSSYQVVLRDHTPPHHGLSLSLAGNSPRH